MAFPSSTGPFGSFHSSALDPADRGRGLLLLWIDWADAAGLRKQRAGNWDDGIAQQAISRMLEICRVPDDGARSGATASCAGDAECGDEGSRLGPG